MTKIRLVICILCACIFSSLSAQSFYSDFRDGMIYVKFVDEFPLDKISTVKKNNTKATTRIAKDQFPFLEKTFQKYGVIAIHRPFTIYENPKLLRILQIEFAEDSKIEDFINDLKGFEEIEYAEKIPFERLCSPPNDPLYGTVNGGDMKWHLDMIKADSAWKIQTGSPNIKVAIIDNYVWGDHPDLQIDSVNLCKVTYDSYTGYSYTLGNTAASPPSSYYTQSSNSNAYKASHGTHCAGLVGAKNDNNIGIASIGSGVTLMGVRAASDGGTLLYTYQGVQWAVENGARVVSMSFGSNHHIQTIETFMKVLYDAGIILVASAGNQGEEGNPEHYPSEYPGVISIASVNGDKKLSYFSQYGIRADVASPGGFIKSRATYPNVLSTTYCQAYILKSRYTSLQNTFYDGMQGTSMACPVAAGLCGLMLSQDSTLSPDEVKRRLILTAQPLHPASSTTINGNGYIDAYAVLTFKELDLKDTLLLSATSQSIDTIKIRATHDWHISNIPSWLTISDSIGSKGYHTIYVSANESNTSENHREVILDVNMGDITKKLHVIQLNYELYLTASPTFIRFSGKRDNADTILISSNMDWKIINSATWINVDKTSGNGSDSLFINTKSANSWGYNRLCSLLVSGINFMEELIIIEQRIPDFIRWETTSTQIDPAKDDNVAIRVLSNVNWTLTGGDSWIEANLSAGTDTMEVVFTVLEDNTTGEEKSTSFTVSNENISKTLLIIQKQDLSISPLSSAENIFVYPNPVSDYCMVQSKDSKIETIKIFDFTGRLVHTYHPTQDEIIDLKNISKGMYFMLITTNKQNTIYRKIIKQ